TSNAVKPTVLAVGQTGYLQPEPGQPIKMLIHGGSKGARIFSDIVPSALAALPAKLRRALFFFSSRRRHTRLQGDWSSDVCSSDLVPRGALRAGDLEGWRPGRGALLFPSTATT